MRRGAYGRGVTLSLAISPCPNDTFVFHALVHGQVPGAPPVKVTYADVDVTNTAARDPEFDLVKVSYAALPWLGDDYALLPCGGALGRGCGPLLLVRGDDPPAGPRRQRGAAEQAERSSGALDTADDTITLAIPGERTTAYLLFRLWAERAGGWPAKVEVVPFPEIMPGVAAGRLDAGLAIHAPRSTSPRYGPRARV